MKIILQQTIIIGGLLFSPAAMATGFTSHDAAAAPGRNAITCMGVNGSGQPADTRHEQRCDAGVKGIYQPTLRGRHS